MRPSRTPTGLQLSQTARLVSRAFDEALERADGSLPEWLILFNLKVKRPANQRALAEAVGIREATLTHHLNAMDARGLLTRNRHPDNRRIHIVELTEAGEAAFLRLRDAAIAFDQQLNHGLSDQERDALTALLHRLAENVGPAADSPTRAEGGPSGGDTAA
jgi:MarR family transcriptional regulator, transcriptional regulator for hemolysin